MILRATEQCRILTSDDDDDDDETPSKPFRPSDGTASSSLPAEQSIVLRIGTRFTTAVRLLGEQPVASRIVSHGPLLLAASQAEAAGANGGAAARLIRSAAAQVAERGRLETLRGAAGPVVGATGIAHAVITLGSSGGSRASLEQVHAATETLASAWVEGKKDGASPKWVGPMLIGSAVLGAILEGLGADEIEAESESPPQPKRS